MEQGEEPQKTQTTRKGMELNRRERRWGVEPRNTRKTRKGDFNRRARCATRGAQPGRTAGRHARGMRYGGSVAPRRGGGKRCRGPALQRGKLPMAGSKNRPTKLVSSASLPRRLRGGMVCRRRVLNGRCSALSWFVDHLGEHGEHFFRGVWFGNKMFHSGTEGLGDTVITRVAAGADDLDVRIHRF